MRIYSIHLPPRYGAPGADPVAIREGFNWWAFLFGFLWALYHRLWWVAGGILLIGIALSMAALSVGLDETQRAVVMLAFMVVVGSMANDWHRARLERKGWREVAVIAAAGPDSALRRYTDLAALDRREASRAAPPPAPPASPAADGSAAPA